MNTNVNIAHTQVTRVFISIDTTKPDDIPHMVVYFDLLSPMGEKISDFTLQTEHWDKKLRLDVPIESIDHARALLRLLGEVANDKFTQKYAALPPAPSLAVDAEATVNNEDVDR